MLELSVMWWPGLAASQEPKPTYLMSPAEGRCYELRTGLQGASTVPSYSVCN